MLSIPVPPAAESDQQPRPRGMEPAIGDLVPPGPVTGWAQFKAMLRKNYMVQTRSERCASPPRPPAPPSRSALTPFPPPPPR
jgi:hypothetical protein